MLVGQSAIQEEVSSNQAECINDINTLQLAFMVYKFLLYLLYLFLGFYNKKNVKIIIGKIRSSEYTPERAVGYCEITGPGQWDSYFASIYCYKSPCKLLEKQIAGGRVDTWARWQVKRDIPH